MARIRLVARNLKFSDSGPFGVGLNAQDFFPTGFFATMLLRAPSIKGMCRFIPFMKSWAFDPLVQPRPLADSGEPEGDDAGSRADSKGHDPDDLHKLVVDHGDAVFRIALSVVKDRALAEDVAQETMVKAWMALPKFRGDSSLRGWVLRIAHNTAISTLRQRRAVVLDPHDMPERIDLTERSVESKVQSGVVVQEFVEALDLLDDLSRSIVVLRELEGLPYDEIAEILDVPMPTVKTRLLRARRKLSAALREWER